MSDEHDAADGIVLACAIGCALYLAAALILGVI